MSATIGTSTAFFSASISATAAMSGTAVRMISHPAAANALACATFPAMSCAGTLSIDCTVTGAPPPIFSPPTVT